MKKYFDNSQKRLVFTNESATSDFWDNHWKTSEFESAVKKYNSFVPTITMKYLDSDSRVLEGGCGRGDHVFSLDRDGFDVYGVDYAEKTVDMINKYAPSLKVRKGDIRELDFKDGFFDGYWSLGVIEHFYDGYNTMISEMNRVLKKEGLLFLTVPVISPVREFKRFTGLYPKWIENQEGINCFYQFAFNKKEIIKDFENAGFLLLSKQPLGGFKGLKDELTWLKPLLQLIYGSRSFPLKLLKPIFEKIGNMFSYHMTLFIFKKL